MKQIPLSRYTRHAAGIAVSGIAWFVTSAFGATQKPFEDFSTWANGPMDTNNNKILDILDEGAAVNSWAVKRGAPYVVGDSAGGRVLILGAGGGPLGWNQIGKPHEINLSGEKAVEISMKVANPREDGASFFTVWLCDEFRNGYGMGYGGVFPMKNRVEVRIFKFHGNTVPFDNAKPKLPGFAEENGQLPDGKPVTLKEIVPPGQFIEFHLRIEQSKSGSPVTLTLWNTGCPEVSDTSYEAPLLKLEDDGKGTAFHSPDGTFGSVMDLSSLTHVGVSGALFPNKLKTPEEQAAEPGLQFKEVDVRIVRP